jgi:hypothetical protein
MKSSIVAATALALGLSLGACARNSPGDAAGYNADLNDIYSADLNGTWTSQSGAVYRIEQIQHEVSALYYAPNLQQTATGVTNGDVAFRGRLEDNFLSAAFYQHISNLPACPSAWFFVPINFRIAPNGNTIEGDLPMLSFNNKCVIAKRWVQHLVLKRSAIKTAWLPSVLSELGHLVSEIWAPENMKS